MVVNFVCSLETPLSPRRNEKSDSMHVESLLGPSPATFDEFHLHDGHLYESCKTEPVFDGYRPADDASLAGVIQLSLSAADMVAHEDVFLMPLTGEGYLDYSSEVPPYQPEPYTEIDVSRALPPIDVLPRSSGSFQRTDAEEYLSVKKTTSRGRRGASTASPFGGDFSNLIRNSHSSLYQFGSSQDSPGCYGHVINERPPCFGMFPHEQHESPLLSTNQIVMPQQESEMLAAILAQSARNAQVNNDNNTTMAHQRQVFELLDEPNEEDDLGVTECRWTDCSARCGDQESLVRHIEKAHVEPRRGGDEFACLWAGCARRARPFNARYKLLIHMRVHSGEKPNKCPFDGCTKAFSRLENLKIHQRSHTGERPYSCQYSGCAKAFSNSSDRAKHQRTHFDTKPYACQVVGCVKRYTDPSSLRKHVKNHTASEQAQARRRSRGDSSPPAQQLRGQAIEHEELHPCQLSYSNSPCDEVNGNYQTRPRHEEDTHSSVFRDESCHNAAFQEADDSQLEYVPFESVRKLLGDHLGYLDSSIQDQLYLESEIEQQFLELSNLERSPNENLTPLFQEHVL